MFYQGDYDGAIQAYQSAQIHHDKPSTVLENRIGTALQYLGDHQQAIDHFTKAIEIEDEPIDRVNRANSYLEIEQCPLAIHDTQRALEMKAQSTKGLHTDAEAHYILGVCLNRTGDNAQATIHLKAALTLMGAYKHPSWQLAKAHVSVGNTLYLEDQHLQAIEHYSQAIVLNDTASARAGRALAYIQTKVTVQTCGDLQAIRPLVEGQPSTDFPLQTHSVPSNVNSYKQRTASVP